MSSHAWGDDQTAIGVDLGGTKIELALVDSRGSVMKRVRQPTEAEKGYAVVKEHACIEIVFKPAVRLGKLKAGEER